MQSLSISKLSSDKSLKFMEIRFFRLGFKRNSLKPRPHVQLENRKPYPPSLLHRYRLNGTEPWTMMGTMLLLLDPSDSNKGQVGLLGLSGWCSTPSLLLICSSFSRENGHPLLVCSSLSTAQLWISVNQFGL